MSKGFAGVPNNSYSPSDNMDRRTAQQYACDSASGAGSSSQASQTHSHTSTSRMGAIVQRYSCSLPLANAPSYVLPPQIDDNNTWIAQSPDFESSFLGPLWDMDGGLIGGPTGYCTDGHLADENYINTNPMHSTSFQVHESNSGFNANDAAPSQEVPGHPIDAELISELLEERDYRYSTSSRTKERPVSRGSEGGRGRSKDSPASLEAHSVSSRKYNSDGNPNDSKVTKAKKIYPCTEHDCEKTFGRSAELKRHISSVHRDRIAYMERQELFDCTHEGCERVGESGFKRKDNLVQHLRGVHGDFIGKKSGRRSATTRMSPQSNASNAGAGSPTIATRNGQFFQSQQEEPFGYTDQQPGMSPWSNASNAGAGSPAIATGNDQFFQGQQEAPVYTDQRLVVEEEGSGTLQFAKDFCESFGF